MSFSLDFIAGLAGFLFTILIFSYLIGDNPLFRIAIYIFTGVSAGYIAAVAWWQVILPRLVIPLVANTPMDQKLLLVAPMIGAVLILMKLAPRLAGLARPVMAFLVGVGAAVTLAGALSGTLVVEQCQWRRGAGRHHSYIDIFSFRCAYKSRWFGGQVWPDRAACLAWTHLHWGDIGRDLRRRVRGGLDRAH
jgi:hypothetical protein